MTDEIRLISIDPWKPRIDQTFAGFPVIISGDPQADIAIEPRWAHGQWCEINDSAAGPRALLHGIAEGEPDRQADGPMLELVDGGEFQIGIRTFRITLSSAANAELVGQG